MATRIPIPLGQQQRMSPLGMPAARAPMVSVDDPTGRAVAGLGQAVGQVGDAVKRVEQEEARTWASAAASADRVKWMEQMQELQSTAEPGAPGFTRTVIERYDAFMEEALNNAPALAKPFYREMLLKEREYTARAATDWEVNQRRAHRVFQEEQAAQADARVVAADPSRYQDILAARRALISTAMLDPDVKLRLWDSARTLLSIAAETSTMQADPQGWLMSRRPGIAGAIRTSAEMAGIDPTYMLAVADIETGGTFDAAAKNPRSSAEGLFQFTDATWSQYAPGQDKRDPAANALAAAAFTADNRKALARSLGRQPVGWEMYLAHQQGAGGAAALLNADPTLTVAQALESAGIPNAQRAANDNGMAGMTVGQALTMWRGKFDRAYQKHRSAPTTHDGFPARQNDDGTISTELTITVTHPELNGGRPTNIPSLWRGQEVDEETAVRNALASGNQYQSFETIDQAEQAARARSAAGGAQADRTGFSAFDNLDWATQSKLEQQAATLMRQRQAEEKALIQDQINDQEATWLAGQDYAGPLVSKDQFVRAYGVQEGLERWAKHQDIYRTGQDIQALTALSDAEIAQSLVARQPVGGPGFEDAAKRFDIYRRAAEAVMKERQSDPAAYVLAHNDAIRQSFEAMRTAGDPDAVQRAARDYASKAIAEQERLGIARPRLLSSNQAEAIVQSFYDQREGSQDAADLISGLEHQWKEHWPLVFEQLSESGKLPSVALVIPNMRDAGARVRAARRALVDEKVYKSRLDSTAPRDIEERLTKEMEDMWVSFANQNGGESSYQAVYGEARKAALEYAANGKSIREAVAQAYSEFVSQNYEFADGYRVPIDQDIDAVSRGARKIVQQVGDMDLLAPESMAFPNMPEEARRAALVDSIKANPVFVTNGDETGLVLYAMADNGLTLVRNKQGQPITFTWAQLREQVEPEDIARDLVDQVPSYLSEQYR